MTRLLELLMALTVALVLSGVFALATWRGLRRSGLIWLFLILFLSTWAGGIWLRPFGPTLWGIHWLTFFLTGIIIALLLALSSSRKAPRGRQETLEMLEQIGREKEMEKITYITLGIIFWILLGLLVLAIIMRFFFHNEMSITGGNL